MDDRCCATDVADLGGATIPSGSIHAACAFVIEGPAAVPLSFYSLYIGIALIGSAAGGPIQPGAKHLVVDSYNPTGALAPSYSSFDPQTCEQTPDNPVSGTKRQDSFEEGGGNDTIANERGNYTLRGGADNDSLAGGAGADVLEGGSCDDYMDGGDDQVIFGPRDGYWQ
ncbi:hypothetical protein C8N30_2941 [Sulfitobacter guttiformis]|uniref:Hemolysin type calcium-binding protein n=1 Tax=Sulfitobacter guttiformis TaxID=74349 RepID=A0A420DHZ5_9RHOB|nr:hypothetical protein C8N30_2941 [Sulfitobacter guttiformis]